MNNLNGPCAHFLFLGKAVTENLEEKLREIVGAAVETLGYEFVGCEYHRQGRRGLLRVYIDSEHGIMLKDCEQASRQISAVLDVEDPIEGGYDLEVSSPGDDRPLFTLAHFHRFVGRLVRIRLSVPQNGRRNYKGVLEVVSDEAITVTGDGETWILPFNDIEKANLVPDDN